MMNSSFSLRAAFAAILVVASSAGIPTARAQGTAFTHQGRLEVDSALANGAYDFQFAVFGAASGGTAVAGPVASPAVDVTAGVFTVRLDFGPSVFTGPARWLEIGVRPAGSGAAFSILSPRQEITAAPYAIHAGTAATATTASSVTANGVGTTALANRAVTSAKIDDGTIQVADLSLPLLDETFWKLGGNAGTTPGANVLGTLDNRALDLRVNNQRGLRLEPAAAGPNVIGGSSANSVGAGAGGAAILGGTGNEVTGSFGAIGGGSFNAASQHAFVGAGSGNRASQNHSVVSGGLGNRTEWSADIGQSAIGGGRSNVIEGYLSVVAGGQENRVGSNVMAGAIGGGNRNEILSGRNGEIVYDSTIAGGYRNRIASSYIAAIGGGGGNVLSTNTAATIGGGEDNSIAAYSHDSTVGGGFRNGIETSAGGTTIAGGQMNQVRTGAYRSTIGGGSFNAVENDAPNGTIGGGSNNTIRAQTRFGTISGGADNQLITAFFGGEFQGTNAPHYATISGGQSNVVHSGDWATVPGGRDNLAGANYSFAAGRRAKAVHSGTFVWADDTDADFPSTTDRQFAVRAGNGVMIQSSGTALDLRGGGAVRVAGAGIGAATPAFTHRASAGNSTGAESRLDHPHCNGRPDAILLVTHVFNPAGTSPGTRNDHAVAVYYNGSRWAIYNLDGAAMPVGASFNVLVIQP